MTEVPKAVVQTMEATTKTEEGTGLRSMASNMGPKLSRPSLKQPTFDWNARDKYKEPRTSR